MAKSNFFNFLIVGALFFSVKTEAQQSSQILPKGFYVVVAAFSPNHEEYAIRLSSGLNKDGMHTKYGFEHTRKYWYVYLDERLSLAECRSEAEKIRGKISDVWVHLVSKNYDGQAIAKAPEKENKSPVIEKEETPDKGNEAKPAMVEIVEEKKPEPVVTEVVENPTPAPVYEPQNLNNTQVFLSLYNMTNNEVIDGEVEVVDPEKSKLISRVKGNQYLTLPNPGSPTGKLLLVSNTFGYRKEQLEVNYKNTEGDTLKPYVTLVGNFYMINFGLSKIRKGDISTLYNVYFFNDAAIMLPDSKYQLNSLLKMLNENPKMKVTLHGHTNGGGRGKIVYMGKSKDFFSMNKDVDNGSGSAKELSEARAECIRQWLIAQGIAEDRLKSKGWGGNRMIYDKNSAYARKNIRVDVEVDED
ncbi:hypothetical protein WSM22_04930 [Cytophagales bacterium WSM2-2]|nr:hypothetical protein WSM22_04930 [Cytophagales bacterium WSM2-2]